MLKKSFSFGIGLVAAMTLGACSSATSNMDGYGVDALAQTDMRASVRVENDSWSDMDVFLLRGNAKIRLGMVTSMGTQRFTIPGNYLNGSSDIRLYADPIGAFTGWTTQPLLISPGQQVAVTLQNNLNLSSYSVY
jgi:hypothetical protein